MDQPDLYPEGVDLYDFDDFGKQRQMMFDDVRTAVGDQFPQSYNGVRVELDKLDYDGPDSYSLKEQREALLQDKYLTRRLRGNLKLFDEETGDLLDERKTTLMQVPYLTERGTYVHNGNEIGSIRQARLLAGPYSRRQANGILETQFQPRVGTGKAFRVNLEPSTGQYRFKIQQSNLHLYSLLKDLGVSDESLEQSWGPKVLDMNRKKYDSRVLDKAYQKLVPSYRQTSELSREDKAGEVRGALEATQFHERVMKKNLPNWLDRSKAASWKSAGTVMVRDALQFVKNAALQERDLDQIILFLNQTNQAGIPVTGSVQQKEGWILDFVSGSGANLSPAIMQAGVEGQQQAAKYIQQISTPKAL